MTCLTDVRRNRDVYMACFVKAFSRERSRKYDLIVRCDGTILVFDPVADHYTTCHSIDATDQDRIRKIAKRKTASYDLTAIVKAKWKTIS